MPLRPLDLAELHKHAMRLQLPSDRKETAVEFVLKWSKPRRLEPYSSKAPVQLCFAVGRCGQASRAWKIPAAVLDQKQGA